MWVNVGYNTGEEEIMWELISVDSRALHFQKSFKMRCWKVDCIKCYVHMSSHLTPIWCMLWYCLVSLLCCVFFGFCLFSCVLCTCLAPHCLDAFERRHQVVWVQGGLAGENPDM